MRSGAFAAALALAACGRFEFAPVPDGAETPPDPDPDAVPAAPDFGSDCVVGYAMNEPTWNGATVHDACGGDDEGTVLGAATTVSDPMRGTVGQFGGPTDCVVISDRARLDLATALTVSAWVLPTGLDGVTPRGILAKRSDDQTDVAYTLFVWTGNRVVVDIDSENDETFGDAVIANARWQMLTGVYDGSQPSDQRIKIYVDGKLDRALPETSAAIPNFPSAVYVGCLPLQPATADQQSFAGRLDDVAIWSRAFSDDEVQAWYEATRR